MNQEHNAESGRGRPDPSGTFCEHEHHFQNPDPCPECWADYDQDPDLPRLLAEARKNPVWVREFRLGPKRGDSLRHLLCLLFGHRWSVNKPLTQRACDRCWLIQRAANFTFGGSNG